jgi:N-acetylmuramoyl-L-alanine amidase
MIPLRRNLLHLLAAACLFMGALPLRAATQASDAKEVYLPASKVAAAMGMEVTKSSDGKKLTYKISSKWSTILIDEGRRTCTVNGILIYLSRPILMRGGSLYMADSDFHKCIEPLLMPQKFAPAPILKTIVIDAGHGGKDNGAENKTLGIKEKNLTLDLAGRLKDELESRGYTVVMTRTRDEFIDLDDRPAIANKAKADFFICLHFNASTDTSVRGAETYIIAPNGEPSSNGSNEYWPKLPGNAADTWNVIAGYYVQRELVNSIGATDRGLRRARFAVLRTLNCPGMLVEGGYVSNPGECVKLGSPTYRSNLARSIADALDAYARTLKRVNGTN